MRPLQVGRYIRQAIAITATDEVSPEHKATISAQRKRSSCIPSEAAYLPVLIGQKCAMILSFQPLCEIDYETRAIVLSDSI